METIIVQDTDAAVLDVLTLALQAENFEVFAIREFDNDFMALIDKIRPHVIIADYRLKGEKAIEILLEIKKNISTCRSLPSAVTTTSIA